MKKNILIILVLIISMSLVFTFCAGANSAGNTEGESGICQHMWDVCYSGLTGYEEAGFKEDCKSMTYESDFEECIMNASSCEDIETCY
jgi:hypothetical protein